MRIIQLTELVEVSGLGTETRHYKADVWVHFNGSFRLRSTGNESFRACTEIEQPNLKTILVSETPKEISKLLNETIDVSDRGL